MTISSILALVCVTTLVYAAPLILTGLGGVFSERGGIVNVALEGIMVMGAFGAIVFNCQFASVFGAWTPWVAVLVGGLAGTLLAALHAVATVIGRADHIISGVVLDLMAPALCVFLIKAFYSKGQTDPIQQSFGYDRVPFLADVPVVGPLLFERTSFPAWAALALTVGAWWLLTKTRFGLRLRAVGENPQAADTLGINVYKMRMAGVLLSGVFGGFGGAVLAQSVVLNFSATTVAGQGFVALAALIFGRWRPFGTALAALFFGLSQSLAVIGTQLPGIQHVPSVYLQIAPYLVTIIILSCFFGKASAPAANGTTYIKTV